MRKKLVASIGAGVLILSLSAGHALAAADAQTTPINPPGRGMMGFGDKNNPPVGMTDADKAAMESQRTEREEKLAAFLATLTTSQKALYDAATPIAPAKGGTTEGKQPQKLDEAAMKAIKESQEAFIASLTETQKTAYGELFGMSGRQITQMTEEQRAEMAEQRAQYETRLAAFLATLTQTQKSAYEALRPSAPTEGKNAIDRGDASAGTPGQRPSLDESVLASLKAQEEAFVASLSESQKAAYQELSSFQMKQPRIAPSRSASTP